MIMAIVITWQMKYADIEPEVNRNRSLYISKMHLQGKEKYKSLANGLHF